MLEITADFQACVGLEQQMSAHNSVLNLQDDGPDSQYLHLFDINLQISYMLPCKHLCCLFFS